MVNGVQFIFKIFLSKVKTSNSQVFILIKPIKFILRELSGGTDECNSLASAIACLHHLLSHTIRLSATKGFSSFFNFAKSFLGSANSIRSIALIKCLSFSFKLDVLYRIFQILALRITSFVVELCINNSNMIGIQS